MNEFLLQAARDTSGYFHWAYAAIGVIIFAYSCALFFMARKSKRGGNG